jgi:pyruvate dehydrogenase E2 component (dihydrolipoamide acetyltransferase)
MSSEIIKVPDLGGADKVEVIEILVSVGESVTLEQSLVVLESDKASMEVPSPKAGKILAIKVKVGDKVGEGNALVELELDVGAALVVAQGEHKAAPLQQNTSVAKPSAPIAGAVRETPVQSLITVSQPSVAGIYAGPAVRKLARELGVNLIDVKATGPRGRLQKDDLHNYIRAALEKARLAQNSGGSALPKIPDIDFSKFGDIELEVMSKIARVTAENMQRSWLNVPHVTQFDDADLTEMDHLRAELKSEAEKRGTKLTPIAFLFKACAIALKQHPKINTSLHNDGKHFVRKKYIHIGLAVDTPAGLMVPVVRDVDQKDIWTIAEEILSLSAKARDGKLKPAEMQGGCFTISSLGAIGGNGFTPVVNAPEVAILGVSKAQIKPQWNGKVFEPKNMLPLCLSYDHRAINGADAGRFLTLLVEVVAKIKAYQEK